MILKIKIWLYIFFYKWLYGYGSISNNVIFAQTIHETGKFTSQVFKENNNLFGMRKPSKRKTFATGSAYGHATFKNLRDSIRDYFERQKTFSISKRNDSEFINDTVNSNYATDPKYKEKWLIWIQKDIKPYSTALLIALFFFIVILTVLIRSALKNK